MPPVGQQYPRAGAPAPPHRFPLILRARSGDYQPEGPRLREHPGAESGHRRIPRALLVTSVVRTAPEPPRPPAGHGGAGGLREPLAQARILAAGFARPRAAAGSRALRSGRQGRTSRTPGKGCSSRPNRPYGPRVVGRHAETPDGSPTTAGGGVVRSALFAAPSRRCDR
jgi:hypothetical protein